ncbi:MAG: Hsp70 family protein [Candidatus Accumulibacter sp.]|nr:Hsp70 family protein [Accumulibacter sp.]
MRHTQLSSFCETRKYAPTSPVTAKALVGADPGRVPATGAFNRSRRQTAASNLFLPGTGTSVTHPWSPNMTALLGIDLGTYNCAAAVLLDDGCEISVSSERSDASAASELERTKPFPSDVLFNETGEIVAVCERAKVIAVEHPHLHAWGLKRLLGKTYIEALSQNEINRLVLPVQPDGGTGRCVLEVGERLVRPEEGCAAILRHIKQAAEHQSDQVFTKVVISVPAYFDAISIGATREAARLAGFDEVQTVPEPVAAALATGVLFTPHPCRTLTVDLGAGTLDVAAAEIWRSEPGPAGLNCLCRKNTGDNRLGGLDFDDCLVDHVSEVLELGQLTDEERYRLRRAVESTKILLSTEPVAMVTVDIGGRQRSLELTRRELEQALHNHRGRDLLKACTEQVHAALAGAGWKPQDVDHLLLIGGPTAMPCIRNLLRGIFARSPQILAQIDRPDADSMLAVAQGAALYARSQTTNRHPYGYGYVAVHNEPLGDEGVHLQRRSAEILVPCDSVFPGQAHEEMAQLAFYRGDKVVVVEIIQHLPESQRSEGEYRFLGTYELAMDNDFFMLDIAQRLNANGELETTLSNRIGFESVTFVGVNGMRRLPVKLPVERKEHRRMAGGAWCFVPDYQGGVRRWAAALTDKVRTALIGAVQADVHVDACLERMDDALAAASAITDERSINELDRAGRSLLARAYELRLVAEADRALMAAELERARRCCYRFESSLAKVE